MGYIGVMTHLPLWLFRPTACEVWKGGRDWHPLTGGGCRLWPRAPGGGSWGKLGVPGAVFSWTPLKTNELDTQNWWFGKIYLLLAIWPFWAYMLKFLGCITFLFLEWRDVLDNVHVGINHPYIINWIVRFGIALNQVTTWRIIPVSKWLITMVSFRPLRIGLWDSFQMT